MHKTSMEVIQSILQSDHYQDGLDKKLSGITDTKPLITLSRSCGANGTEIARMVATELGVYCYDRELLHKVVKEIKTNRQLMEQIDEKATYFMDDVLHALFSKKSISKDLFLRYLIKVILGICKTGGVIVGRGAHLLIPEQRKVLRVRIDGSLEVCSRRIAERMDLKLAKARQLVQITNGERNQFVAQLYRRYPTHRTYYDLLINSDLFTSQQAMNIILAASHEIGFKKLTPTESLS